ncbi:unnamed protein product [Adineta steineri]|uniref:Uncharacterized protein n=1 Tax=Adineta steineri TaxID=433720 RepID=A0A815XRQ4_9BILA|nr:unnamed protein product [Adineta steineri]CAF1664756.1 unnamed protein product [Adineta steineri]
MVHDFVSVSNECIPEIVRKNQQGQHEQQLVDQTISSNREDELIMEVESPSSSSDIDQTPEDVLPPPGDIVPQIAPILKKNKIILEP